MKHTVFFMIAALFLGLSTSAVGQGSFCGAVGTPGCNAIRFDSSIVAAWATGCTVARGPVDIVEPDGPRVHYGEDEYGIGPASTVTTTAVSLGDGGTATLTFDEPVRNVPGPDFAVFENSYDDNFLELAFVEVSSDGERFVRFPSTSLTPTTTQIGPYGQVNPTMINNLAGKYRVGYGTPFDLDELRDSTGLDLNHITHVRLVDVVGTIDPQYATHDAFGHIVNDPYPTRDTIWGSGGFDLTGVAVLFQSQEGIEEAVALEMKNIYPNPASDFANVSVNRAVDAQLFDLSGCKMADIHLDAGQNTLNISNLKSGIYILRTEGNSKKIVKK